MYTIDLRNLLHLPWKKIILLGFFTLGITVSRAQNLHQADYDAKKIRFGYLLGLTQTQYKIRYNEFFLLPGNTDYFSITSPTTYAFKMGGVVNVRIDEQWDFRTLPTVGIYSRALQVVQATATQRFQNDDKAWFELPVYLKYKSNRRGNTRMYFIGGFRYGTETNAVNFNGRRSQLNQFVIRKSDFALEYGFGFELFQQYFKLTPEIVFSHGLPNLVQPGISANTPLGSIQRLSTHGVSFHLIFE